MFNNIFNELKRVITNIFFVNLFYISWSIRLKFNKYGNRFKLPLKSLKNLKILMIKKIKLNLSVTIKISTNNIFVCSLIVIRTCINQSENWRNIEICFLRSFKYSVSLLQRRHK